ncbi:O-antigen ligase family protein [Candidatus Pelagibacter sp.]|nr:O-antigen ligase family protein [Candidatus Pelagibacter sp.]
MKKFIQNYQINFEKVVFGFWTLVFLIVSLDGIVEIVFGFNTLGFSTPQEGRVSGFFGEELVLGGFFHCFCLIFISYIFNFFSKNNVFILLMIILLILISFLIGERSNFIKVFLSLSFLSFFIIKLKLRYFIFSFIILFSILFLFINFNYESKNRYFDQVKKIYETKEINSYLIKSPYGAHYNAAYKIFEEYPIFGIGIKNFRTESAKEKYKNDEYEWTQFRSTTHPHQIHLELLAETGIFGYIFFLFFILSSLYLSLKNYFKYKNTFQLSSILYVFFYLTPILPSGSFFATFSSALFWINYSIMVSYIKK